MGDHRHHHYHDGHDHGQQQSTSPDDFTEENRKHWNKYAASYTSEQWQKDLVSKATSFILANISWVGVEFVDPSTTFEKPSQQGEVVRVLDYACGPGTITHALAGRATEYIGVDISENMVKAYNLRFNPVSDQSVTALSGEDRGDERLNARAVVGNLLDAAGTPTSLDDPKYKDFDLVAVGFGYHHFADLTLATSRLVERLRPGGVFLILDFVTHPVMDHEKKHPATPLIAHHGFSEDGLKQIFESAGLTDFGMRRMGETVLMKGIEAREMLLAKGRKA